MAASKKIEIALEGVIATATLFEEKAPKTCAKFWETLPIEDRTIHVRWSGPAWRTEKNYPFDIGEIENKVSALQPGDIIYYDDPRYSLYKIALSYGDAEWRDRHGVLSVALIGRVEENLPELIKISERILFEGPKRVQIRRK